MSAAGIERTVLISADARSAGRGIGEVWAYRELVLFLIWRDVKVRYAHTALGAAWAIAQPTAAAALFTIVFARIGHVPSDGVSYPIFALAGLVPWMYISGAVTTAGASLVNNAHVITKVYFPRLAIPLAAAGAGLVDCAVAFLVLIVAIVATGLRPLPVAVVLVPALLLVFTVIAAGAGCWLAALTVRYRDVKHLTPLLTMVWLYASPVAYPLSRVPADARWIYALNPLAGTLAAFRAVLVGGSVDWGALAISTLAAGALCAAGMSYFQRTERVFADIV
jgi:lipopolysaccharide transport system permease protein